MLIDGSIYLAEGGRAVRYDAGQTSRGWSVKPPDDGFLRTGTPRFSRISSPDSKDQGNLYIWDSVNKRVLAFDKASGNFIEQYMPAGGSKGFDNIGEMFVLTGASGTPGTLFWTEGGNLMSASLNQQPVSPELTPSPSPTLPICGPRPTAKAGKTPAPTPPCVQRTPSPKPSAKATAKPTPKPTPKY
jgi:hypothetical protein